MKLDQDLVDTMAAIDQWISRVLEGIQRDSRPEDRRELMDDALYTYTEKREAIVAEQVKRNGER